MMDKNNRMYVLLCKVSVFLIPLILRIFVETKQDDLKFHRKASAKIAFVVSRNSCHIAATLCG